MQENFFDNKNVGSRPLADRMRPDRLQNFVGQKHLIAPNTVLYNAIKNGKLGSCIFYGPSGCGKTTLARIVASYSNSVFVQLNAVSSGVADAKKIIEDAKNNLQLYGKKTYLMLDECHRWNKAQSDSVLAAIEDGTLYFIGCTTENPNIAMTKAIVSRCKIFELLPLTQADILQSLNLCLNNFDMFDGMVVSADEDALKHIAWACSGDLRIAFGALELAVLTSPISQDGSVCVQLKTAEQAISKKSLSIDQTNYYDMLSAFCKSLRGSASDAALYWAFRLMQSGCDPMLVLRRLVVHASEDVGMADSNAFVIATNAMLAYERLGYDQGSIPLAHAIIYVAKAPKSNAVIIAKDSVLQDVQDYGTTKVPFYLRDKHYKSTLDDGSKYLYPHDYPNSQVEQEYMPDELRGRVYYQEK